jgi:hypothetical protein
MYKLEQRFSCREVMDGSSNNYQGEECMKTFRMALTSVFLVLLCICNTTFAQESTTQSDFIEKSKCGEDCIGRRGHRGHHGKRGREGEIGRPGATGLQGGSCTNVAGPTGATGTDGTSGSPTFISAYEVGGIVIGNNPPNDPSADIMFPNLISQFGAISQTGGVFTTTDGPGNYEVTFGGKWTGDTAIGLMVNDVLLTGSLLEPEGADYSTISVIVPSTTPTTTFEIRHQDATTMTLFGDADHTAAFITIKKIS